MNYDAIIVELLARIQSLESRVNALEEAQKRNPAKEDETNDNKKVGTESIRRYIIQLKKEAEEEGRDSLIITSREIHGALGLKSRYPMVCNAMRQVMQDRDEILYSPESGYSSTLKIKYNLTKEKSDEERYLYD